MLLFDNKNKLEILIIIILSLKTIAFLLKLNSCYICTGSFLHNLLTINSICFQLNSNFYYYSKTHRTSFNYPEAVRPKVASTSKQFFVSQDIILSLLLLISFSYKVFSIKRCHFFFNLALFLFCQSQSCHSLTFNYTVIRKHKLSWQLGAPKLL